MRRLIIALVLLVVISGTALAVQPREAYLGSITAIAWLEGDNVLKVAMANESNLRSMVTLSTRVLDSRLRPVLPETRYVVTVPARSIVVETVRLRPVMRGETIDVTLSEGRRSVSVPIQEGGIFKPTSYIVEANTAVEVVVDLPALLTDSRVTRIVLDDFYESSGSPSRGRIQVKSFEGGWKYIPSRNSIEYVQPELVLSMRAPQTFGLATMTFSIRKIVDGYRIVEEEIPGPTILVYGRNLRFTSSDSPSNGSDTGWISK